MAAVLYGGPIVLRLEVDRCGDREPRGEVACALPLETSLEDRRARVAVDGGGLRAAFGHVAPAHHRRLQQSMVLGPRMQERAALRGAQPLVAVARVEVGAHLGYVERDVTRHV